MQSNNPMDIHSLVQNHAVEQVITALEKDSKLINSINKDGMSLLQLAAREGLNDLVTYLCFNGANVHYPVESKESKTEQADKTALQLANEYGHNIVVNILEVFNHSIVEIDQLTLKSLYIWAIKHYDNPAQIILPRAPSLFICQGLLELAAYLNKPLWAEKILSLHDNFQLRNDILIRTPAYWAACHNNDALFQKVCSTNSNSSLTLWQLQEDNQSAALKPFFSSLEVKLEDLPEDKTNISAKYKNGYIAALKAKEAIVRQFSFELQRTITEHSLTFNNFVPLVVMQQQLKSSKHEFIMSSLDLPMVIEFELLSNNLSFYYFALKLSAVRHNKFLIKYCNRTGLLNYLLSKYLIQKQFLSFSKLDNTLSNETLAIYHLLSKNDRIMVPLAEQQLENHDQTYNRIALFKFFGLPFSVIDKKSSIIKDLPDDCLAHVFLFLNKSKSLSQTNKRFYTTLLPAEPSSELIAEVKTMSDQIQILENEIVKLDNFEEELESARKQNPKCLNRFAIGWSMTGLLAFPAAFIANVFCILKLREDKHDFADKMSAIKYTASIQPDSDGPLQAINLTCNTFYQEAWYGCNPWSYDCKYYDYFCPQYKSRSECIEWTSCKVYPPSVCSDSCNSSYWTDVNFALSIGSSVLLGLALCCTVPCFLHCFTEAKDNKLHEPDRFFDSYPEALVRKADTIKTLLTKRSRDLADMNNFIDSIKKSKKDKYEKITKLNTDYKNAGLRKRVLGSFFQPVQAESKQEWPIDMKDEPPKVSHIGSLNDTLKTPLLNNQDREVESKPRKSLCPACVIL